MSASVLDAEQFKRHLREHPEFSVLTEEELDALLGHCSLVSHSLGDTILREGEPGDAAFLICSGRLRILREHAGRPVTLATCQAGELIGERAILSDEPRNATVRAAADILLLKIPQAAFRSLVERNAALRKYVHTLQHERELVGFLRTTMLGRAVPLGELMRLLDRLEPVSFRSGEPILREGEPGEHLFLVRSGEAKVLAGRNGRQPSLGRYSAGDFFGERALFENSTRTATVVAATDCDCLRLARSDFDELLKSAPDIQQEIVRRLELYRVDAELEKKFGPPPEVRSRRPAFDDSTIAAPVRAEPSAEESPETPERGRSARRRRRLFRKFPLVRQLDETDCGAACLAMVSKFHGVSLSVGRLRDLASVGREGASFSSLAAAAEQLGYSTRALKLPFDRLRSLELPAIAHWRGFHYVVVYQVKGDRVTVADPAVGVSRLTREEFEAGWTGRLLSLTPTSTLVQTEPAKTTFRRFLPYLRPHRGLLFEIFLASIILELFQLVSPVFTQIVVDRVLVHQNVHMLNLMLVGMLIVSVFQMVIGLLRDYFSTHLAQKLSLRFSSDLLRQMLRLPLRFFHTRRIGDVMQRFEDNEEIQDVLTGKAISTVLDMMTVVLTIGLMLYYSPPLTAVALFAIPLYAGLTLAFTPALKRNNLEAVEQSAAANSHLIELFKSIGTVKSSAAEDPARWRQENHLVREANVAYRDAALDRGLSGASTGIDIIARLLLFWYGAHLVIAGELTVGQLVAFQLLVGMALEPVMNLIGLWDELQEAFLSLQRLADVHDFEPEQAQGASAIRLPRLRGAIQLQNVSFRYGLDDENILSGLNLEIDPGTTVALVGRSGSGKTTLVNLLQRFYHPTEGRVLIDGFDLTTADVKSLREQLGVVPQSPEILSGTIRENIALADPEASLERVLFAAKIAGAHDFITGFPMSYDTVIGEAGIRLSGGQMQRIAIARALLNDPRILIFDEATSALDAESEKLIQQNMESMLRDRTALIVAHRLSTVKKADRIVVLDRGMIIEEGTHRELLDRRGLYYYLVSQQMTL
ncbi:MAG: peptidase domain-containing ABC transporter [Planctomycetes bacterium]|nr:peptidase domain-containing ABC transporter [Planctomycetota bacterium]